MELWRRHYRNVIDRQTFVALAAGFLAMQRARAVTLADISVATTVSRLRGEAVAPLGLLLPEGEPERLAGSVRTVLDADVQIQKPDELAVSRQARFARLGRDVPPDALTRAMGDAMQGHGVGGWTRSASGSACELCRNWADGVVRPPSVSMVRHTGCGCVQQLAL